MRNLGRSEFLLSFIFVVGIFNFDQSSASKSEKKASRSGRTVSVQSGQNEKRKNVLKRVTKSKVDHVSSAKLKNEKRENILRRIAKLNVDYISPASGIIQDFRKEYLKDIRKFGVVIPNEAFVNRDICRFSDTDINRFIRLERSVNSDSDIVWATRGGFGSYKMIDQLASVPQPKKRKILIGFSDITALNLYVSQNWKNWTVIHAPMIVHTAKDRYHHKSWSVLLDILEHRIKQYKIAGLSPLNNPNTESKKITGELTGGNLSLLETSLKTNWEIDTDDKILFIEDCNESAPSVYRSMYHLKAAGKLSKVKAIIFGEFVGVKGYEKYLKHFSKELNIPMFITDKFGHGKKNFPLVYGAKARIENNSLIVDLSEKM